MHCHDHALNCHALSNTDLLIRSLNITRSSSKGMAAFMTSHPSSEMKGVDEDDFFLSHLSGAISVSFASTSVV